MDINKIALLAQTNSSDENIEALFSAQVPYVKHIASLFYVPGLGYFDKIQIVNLASWQALPKWEASKSSYKTYLYTVGRRILIDEKRKVTCQKHDENLHVELKDNIRDDSQTVIEDDIKREEFHFNYKKLYDALQPFEQGVLIRYLDGNTYEEIAKLVGCDEKKVDNTLQRIKQTANRVGWE